MKKKVKAVVTKRTAPVVKKPVDNNYVDNKEFLAAIIDYRKQYFAAVKKNQPKPKIPEYIGECFLRIATHLSYKLNFSNYMFREDMVADAVENCVLYFMSFDPEKSSNPFSYFTQTAYFAFLRRIKKEKRQFYIKLVSYENSKYDAIGDPLQKDFAYIIQDGRNETDFDKFARQFVDEYEAQSKVKAESMAGSTKPQGLEQIMVEESDDIEEDV